MRLYKAHSVSIRNQMVCEITVLVSDLMNKSEGQCTCFTRMKSHRLSTSSPVFFENDQTKATCTLHLSVSRVQDGGRSEVDQVMASVTEQPLETTAGAIVSGLQPIVAVGGAATSMFGDWQPLLDKIGLVMKMTEGLSEVCWYGRVTLDAHSCWTDPPLHQSRVRRDFCWIQGTNVLHCKRIAH